MANLMQYITLALLICAFATSTQAYCTRKGLKLGQTHCFDDVDHTKHEVGSSWRNSKCMDCTCTGCCTAYSTPVNIPTDCVSVLDPVSCQYIVHKKNDRTKLCETYSAVGK